MAVPLFPGAEAGRSLGPGLNLDVAVPDALHKFREPVQAVGGHSDKAVLREDARAQLGTVLGKPGPVQDAPEFRLHFIKGYA
jgi:hypothetical protein